MSGARIVTAAIGPEDFAWLDAQRRAHFPPERNHLGAHLTLFHALPPSADDEIRTRLAAAVRRPPPRATIAGLMNLGRGVAYRVASPDLERIRGDLAEAFHGMLSAQDQASFRSHVTIQNKVDSTAARALQARLEHDFEPRPLRIVGLELHEYRGGPWAPLGRWPFRG